MNMFGGTKRKLKAEQLQLQAEKDQIEAEKRELAEQKKVQEATADELRRERERLDAAQSIGYYVKRGCDGFWWLLGVYSEAAVKKAGENHGDTLTKAKCESHPDDEPPKV
jgi:hypothetical protein